FFSARNSMLSTAIPAVSGRTGRKRARSTRGNPWSLFAIRSRPMCSRRFADRHDDAELGKMGSDRVDYGGPLANEQMTGVMEHQAALLLGRLGRHKPHVRPANRFADRLGISGIVLLSLHVRLHAGWRHQCAKRDDPASRIVA